MDWLNSLFLPLYQVSSDPGSAFYLGTFLLALLTAVLGEVTIVLLYLNNRTTFIRLHQELSQTHIQSIDAIERNDAIAYEAHHRKANEAFSKAGMLQIALMIGSLWPVFFATAFLSTQFADIQYPLPLVGWKIHCVLVYMILYGLSRLLLSPLKYRISGMHELKDSLDDARAKAKELSSLLADKD